MLPDERLLGCDHVLMALDGPMAELPPPAGADQLRVMIADALLPRKVARTDDPFTVLAHASTIGPATEKAVHAQLCRIEYESVGRARAVPGLREAVARLAAAGTHVTAVSRLSVAAVRYFLVMNGLAEHVRHLAARTGPSPAGLPPAPDLVAAAVRERAIPVEECVFVGSTRRDLAAAKAAGVATIRHHAPAGAAPPQSWFAALS